MLQGSRRAAKAALLVVGLGLAFGSFTANGASAPGAKIRQTDLSLRDQPAGGEYRQLKALSMDRLGNLYAIEIVNEAGNNGFPRSLQVLVFDSHDRLTRRIPLDIDPNLAGSDPGTIAISPLGDAFAVAYRSRDWVLEQASPAIWTVIRFDADGHRVGAAYDFDTGSGNLYSIGFNGASQLGIMQIMGWGGPLLPAVCAGRQGCISFARLNADARVSLPQTMVDASAGFVEVKNGIPQGPNYQGVSGLALRDDGGFYLAVSYAAYDPGNGYTYGQRLDSYSPTGSTLQHKFERVASNAYQPGTEVRLFDTRPTLSLSPTGRPLFSWWDGVAPYDSAYLDQRAPISVERWSNGASGVPTTFPDLQVSAPTLAGIETSASDAFGRSALLWTPADGSDGRCALFRYSLQMLDSSGNRSRGVLGATPQVSPDAYGPRCLGTPPSLLMDADGDLAVLGPVPEAVDDAVLLGDSQYLSRYAGPEPVDLALSVLQSGFGQKASYRYTVKNKHAKSTATGITSVDGAIGAATGVSITLTLSGGQYTGFSGSGWACASADGVHVACDYSPVIAATKSASALTVDAGIACRGKLTTAATVSSNQYDAQAGNDSLTNSKSAPAFGKCS